MPDLRARLIEDRYLRDSAKALFHADIAHVKADLARKGIAARAADRIKEGAADVYDEAVDVAENNKGVLAALVAAVVLWFARNPILSLFGIEPDDESDDPQTYYDEDEERRPWHARFRNKR